MGVFAHVYFPCVLVGRGEAEHLRKHSRWSGDGYCASGFQKVASKHVISLLNLGWPVAEWTFDQGVSGLRLSLTAKEYSRHGERDGNRILSERRKQVPAD
jgi:hypothetical protein